MDGSRRVYPWSGSLAIVEVCRPAQGGAHRAVVGPVEIDQDDGGTGADRLPLAVGALMSLTDASEGPRKAGVTTGKFPPVQIHQSHLTSTELRNPPALVAGGFFALRGSVQRPVVLTPYSACSCVNFS